MVFEQESAGYPN